MRRIRRRDVAESANNVQRTKRTETMWLEDSEKMGNAERYREREREKEFVSCKQEKAGEEKIIPLVIYMFHKYSLSREKVKPEKGWSGRAGTAERERAREERIFG